MQDILALFDRTMRRDPPPEPGMTYQWVAPVTRGLGDGHCVLFSDLEGLDADAVIAREAGYFQPLGQVFEWKLFSHDRPSDLGDRLARAGFAAEETETLVVFDLAQAAIAPDEGTVVRAVETMAGLMDFARVTGDAFDGDPDAVRTRFEAYLDDPTLRLYVAYQDGAPVSAGRLSLPPGRAFAGLWGGGTAHAGRGRGFYRALVAARAAEAIRLGYRYLTVDARETSRPILERLGFRPLTKMTAYTLEP